VQQLQLHLYSKVGEAVGEGKAKLVSIVPIDFDVGEGVGRLVAAQFADIYCMLVLSHIPTGMSPYK